MKTELLAPAGSLAGLKAVISAGADAVYIGGTRFGARAYADNPAEEELIRGIDYAHLRGAKVYMTVNTLLKQEELQGLVSYMEPYVRCGLDAVLVQDFGVLSLLRQAFPTLPLHASTQMTVTGPAGASLLKEYGVTRVVPARELSLPELVRIRAESGLEVEVFVHGALCYCYSGECLLSSFIGGRSGNRGRCAQPCRLLNLLNDTKGFDGSTSILERPDARHYMSPKDLCAIGLLPEFVRSGIDSLKIEGRMKQPEYAAGVVSVYRACLDRALADPDHYQVTEEEQRKLYDLYNRSGFTEGYFHTHNGPEMMALIKHELTGEETKARHSLYDQMHAAYMEQPDTMPAAAAVYVKCGEPIRAELRLTEEAAARYSRALPAEAFPAGPGAAGEEKTANGFFIRAAAEGPAASRALKQPVTAERIREQTLKAGGTDFALAEVRVETDGESFLPVSQLNELRRNALAALSEAMLAPFRRTAAAAGSAGISAAGNTDTAAGQQAAAAAAGESGETLSVLVSTWGQLEAALKSPAVSVVIAEAALLYGKGRPVEEALRFIDRCRQAGKRPAIAMPRVDRTEAASAIWPSARDPKPAVPSARAPRPAQASARDPQAADGTAWELKHSAPRLLAAGLSHFLVRSLETYACFRQEGLLSRVRTDASLYTFNKEARQFLLQDGTLGDTAPLELNRRELFRRDNTGSEIILYGLLPLMLSAQCLRKNTGRCTRAGERMTLTDRTGTKFKVKCECIFCYNILYNYLPLSLFSELDTLRRMGFRSFRVELTEETEAEARDILSKLYRTGDGLVQAEAHSGAMAPAGPSTRGHFLRGVE